MDWKQLLAYITGTVDQELLLRNEYLVTENRILRNQIKGRMRIPVIPATQSGAKLPPNPKEACHPIRTKAAPHRSPIGAQRRLG